MKEYFKDFDPLNKGICNAGDPYNNVIIIIIITIQLMSYTSLLY